MKKLCLHFLLALALAVSLLLQGCAPRAPLSTEASSDPVVLSPDQQLANFLGESTPGASSSFAGTSLGASATVTAYGAYVSGLGEFCREGVAVLPRGKTRVAACRDKETRNWRLAPAIFGHGAL